MDPSSLIPTLLGIAVLLPLASFVVILCTARYLKEQAAWVAICAIGGACLLSFISMFGSPWYGRDSRPARSSAPRTLVGISTWPGWNREVPRWIAEHLASDGQREMVPVDPHAVRQRRAEKAPRRGGRTAALEAQVIVDAERGLRDPA